jgi:hypothetical protein
VTLAWQNFTRRREDAKESSKSPQALIIEVDCTGGVASTKRLRRISYLFAPSRLRANNSKQAGTRQSLSINHRLHRPAETALTSLQQDHG